MMNSGMKPINIFWSMKYQLMRQSSIKCDKFWDEANQLCSECEASAHKKRRGSYLFLPFALSIRELIERVHRGKPGVSVPLEEW